jgi:hypothetical protein
MLSLMGLSLRKRSKPLAHCADRSPGTLRLVASDDVLPVTILQADATGVVVRAERDGHAGEQVIGDYKVSDVAFAFRGTVSQVTASREGGWDWHIHFILGAQ